MKLLFIMTRWGWSRHCCLPQGWKLKTVVDQIVLASWLEVEMLLKLFAKHFTISNGMIELMEIYLFQTS